MMSMALVGQQVDIIPHTGIVVEWGSAGSLEYFYGGGICVTGAGQSMPMQPCEVIDMGTTEKTEADLQAFLASISARFSAETYNLLSHNCNHFSNEVARFLTGGRTLVPDRIVNIAQEALSSPQGQQLRGMIEGLEQNMRQQNSGNQLNPLGHVGSEFGGAPASIAASPIVEPDLGEIRGALQGVDGVTVEQRLACLGTLTILAANIVKKPMELKYKRVKMENKTFAEKVGLCEGGTELMVALGFLPDEVEGVDYWVWGSVPGKNDMLYLQAAVDQLNLTQAALK